MNGLMNPFFLIPFKAAIDAREWDIAEDIATKAGNILAVNILRQRHSWHYGIEDFAEELPGCLRMQAHVYL